MSSAFKIFPPIIRKTRRTRLMQKADVMWRQRNLYVLIIPSLVVVFIFNYIPLYGLTLAFRDYDFALGPFKSLWIKPLFANFWFLKDPEFWYVLGNTARISGIRFVFSWPAPIILALLLNEVRSMTFKRTIQTVSYLPHFISWVILAGIIHRLLGWDAYSPINKIRGLFGAAPVALMGKESFFIPLLVMSGILKEIGWGTIIYLASISTINPELYEQASMDGAGRIRQTFHITLPGMLPVISILLVLSIPSLLQAGFDQIYNLMNASVRRIANVTDIYVLRMGLIQGRYACATAIGLVFGTLGFTLTMIANRISKGSVGYGIW